MKVPIRTCIVCRKKQDKNSLLRILYTNNKIEIDFTGNKAGRGAYVCNKDCLNKLSIKAIKRAFKINIDNNEIINLRNDDMAL